MSNVRPLDATLTQAGNLIGAFAGGTLIGIGVGGGTYFGINLVAQALRGAASSVSALGPPTFAGAVVYNMGALVLPPVALIVGAVVTGVVAYKATEAIYQVLLEDTGVPDSRR